MNPQNQYQPQQTAPTQPTYSIDYLNQISAPPPRPSGPPKWLVLGGIVVFVLILIFGAIMVLNSGESGDEKAQKIVLRVGTLKTIATDQQKNLRDPNLRNINSTLILLLTSAETNASSSLASAGIATDSKKIPASITAKEETFMASLTSVLENGRLNATLDRTYPREVAYQLRLLLNDLSALKKTTKSQILKIYADTTTTDLTPIIKKLSDFTEE